MWKIVSILSIIATSSFAHGGGLDGAGCHNDNKNKEYHCHQNRTGKRNPNSDKPYPHRPSTKQKSKEEICVDKATTEYLLFIIIGTDVEKAEATAYGTYLNCIKELK